MSRPFPNKLAGEEINGECLVLLDSTVAGYITTFVGGAGARTLNHEQLRILRDCENRFEKYARSCQPSIGLTLNCCVRFQSESFAIAKTIEE